MRPPQLSARSALQLFLNKYFAFSQKRCVIFSPEIKRLTAIQVLISPRSSLRSRCKSNWTKMKNISDSSSRIRLLNIAYLIFFWWTPFVFIRFLGLFFQVKEERMHYFLLMQSIVRFCRFGNWTLSFGMDCLPAPLHYATAGSTTRNSL